MHFTFHRRCCFNPSGHPSLDKKTPSHVTRSFNLITLRHCDLPVLKLAKKEQKKRDCEKTGNESTCRIGGGGVAILFSDFAMQTNIKQNVKDWPCIVRPALGKHLTIQAEEMPRQSVTNQAEYFNQNQGNNRCLFRCR